MNRKILSVSAGLACLAVSALPGLAGDWNNGAGSIKDRGRAAVPVPAPMLVPDGPSGWYLRLDVGLGRESNHGAKENGISYGAGNFVDSFSGSGAGFGSSSGWFEDGFETNVSYGGGVGYIWGRNWRSDVTLDRRASTEYKMRGTYQYNNNVINPAFPVGNLYVPPALPATPQRIDGTSNDVTSMKSGVLMLNTYYDWKNRSAFTPYVGLGVGLAYLDLDRQHTTSDTSCDPTTLPIPCATTNVHRSFSGSDSETKLVWAAAAHAGFSYAFTDVTSLDINYRMLYIPGTNIDMPLNGGKSRVTFNDITEHQLRAGLRWNIN
ncbi:MAG: outer membrane beta-barrel protein [Hyphomicrobiaceae bacterium]